MGTIQPPIQYASKGLSQGQSGQNVKLTTHIKTVPRLRQYEAVPAPFLPTSLPLLFILTYDYCRIETWRLLHSSASLQVNTLPSDCMASQSKDVRCSAAHVTLTSRKKYHGLSQLPITPCLLHHLWPVVSSPKRMSLGKVIENRYQHSYERNSRTNGRVRREVHWRNGLRQACRLSICGSPFDV